MPRPIARTIVPQRTRIATLAIALISLLGLEAIAAVAGPRLGRPLAFDLAPPLEWFHADYQRIVQESDAIDERTDILIVGSSMVMFDIRSGVLAGSLDGADFVANVGVPDATATVIELWLRDVVLPRLAPSRVIWGLASMDFNAFQSSTDDYRSTRATGQGFVDRLDRVLARISPLSRHRETLRSPAAWVDGLLGLGAPSLAPYEMPLGSAPRSRYGSTQTEWALGQVRWFLQAYEIGEAHQRAFRNVLAVLLADGSEVVLVLMPVPAAYVASHPRGTVDHDMWRTWVTAEALSLGLPVLDYSTALDERLFMDYTHLSYEGSVYLTTLLVEDLRQLGW